MQQQSEKKPPRLKRGNWGLLFAIARLGIAGQALQFLHHGRMFNL